ncbi:5-formyltetrahydrofolate cyclo-ligase protein [Raphanus sativus]|nr:5-formyltetrahydrofolate cyclo-ligase protein [Raphanus sativus]
MVALATANLDWPFENISDVTPNFSTRKIIINLPLLQDFDPNRFQIINYRRHEHHQQKPRGTRFHFQAETGRAFHSPQIPKSHGPFLSEPNKNTVLEAPWFKSGRRLCAYISCKSLNEVDTCRILSNILQHPDSNTMAQKKLYVPWVEDKNSNMRMLHISHMDDLIANSMNILEPAPVDAHGNDREDVMQTDEPIDLFILPGLAFDRCGRRLGRGGGYYDTFLKRYQDRAKENDWSNPLMVALSYSPQILEDGSIPVTPNDVMIDALVTPSGVVPISPRAIERM